MNIITLKKEKGNFFFITTSDEFVPRQSLIVLSPPNLTLPAS